MNVNTSIISTLSPEQKEEFLFRLKKKNKRGDVKNVALFLLLDKNEELKDIDIALYGKPSKGAYHAVSKRLHDSLIDFIATKSFKEEASSEMEVMKLLLASRTFFEHQQEKIAFKTLAKAEHKAKELQMFHLLNEVYITKIQNLHKNPRLDLAKEMLNYKKNRQAALHEEDLNLFYASVQRDLEIELGDPTSVIENNLTKFSFSLEDGLTYASLLKIIEIYNTVAHIARSHNSLWSFIEDALIQLEKNGNHSVRNLNAHIQLLYYLANFNFRRKDFKATKMYLKSMLIFMESNNRQYYERYFLRFTLLKSLLAIFTGSAQSVLAELQNFKYSKYKKEFAGVLDLQLTQVISLFLLGRFSEAFKIYKTFYHSDVWYANKIGNVWVIQKNLIELLILVELDEFDLFTARLLSFRKKHKSRLLQRQEEQVLEYLKLIAIYYKDSTIIAHTSFQERVAALLKEEKIDEDIFTIYFYSWFDAKIKKKEVYKICVENVGFL
jgi:hypothetical protein